MRIPSAMYLVVGDSQAMRCDGLVLEDPAGPIVVKARWQPASRMVDLYRDGKLSEYLTRILMELRNVVRTAEPQAFPFPGLPEPSPHSSETIHFRPRDPERLVLMFNYGEADLWDIADELYPVYDFDLEPGTPGLDIIPHDDEWTQKMDADAARSLVEERCSPLFNSLLALREAGYPNLFLHALAPPSTKRELHWKPFRLRFKLAVLFNRIFEEFAAANGIGFVSIWDAVFGPEGRNRKYVKDSAHLNQASGALSIRKLHALLSERG